MSRLVVPDRHRRSVPLITIAVAVVMMIVVVSGRYDGAERQSADAVLRSWYALAPRPLGGTTTYLRVHGGSMEPVLSGGDIIAVRASTRYEPGDIIAYVPPADTTIILHRVLAVTTRPIRYVVKGDANHFVDRFQPTPDRVIGRSIITIPVVRGLRHFIDHHPLLAMLRSAPVVADRRQQTRAGHNDRRICVFEPPIES